LSRSYSSGALLESDHVIHESRHREFDTSYDDDELDDYGEEDNTLQESGEWARARRPSAWKLSASVGARPAMPPPTSWNHRPPGTRTSGGSAGARTSTSSAGSGFSLEVTIPEGEEREGMGRAPSSASSTSRMARPSGRSSLGSSTGARDSSGSSTFDHPRVQTQSRYHRQMPTKRPSGDEAGTPSSPASTLSIPMPGTPKDYDALLSATTPVGGSSSGLGIKFNKEKSLPPLPSGGLKRPASRTNLVANSNSKSTSNAKSTGANSNAKSTSISPSNAKSTSTLRTPSDGSSAKYAFPRARTFSSTSSASATSHTVAGVVDTAGSPPTPVRPLQLPRQAVSARPSGDRPAVPVPSIPGALNLSSSTSRSALRTPSLTSARFAASGYTSMPSSPLLPGMNSNPNANSTPTPTAGTGMARPKPRTGTGMVYRTSTTSMGSKMRAPLALASGSAGAVGGAGGGGSIGRAAGRPIVL